MSFVSPINPGAIDQYFNALVNSSAGSDATGAMDEPRSALSFSSRLRQIIIDGIDPEDPYAMGQRSDRLAYSAVVRNTGLPLGQSLATFQTPVSDLTNQLVRAQSSHITMKLNPKTIEFDQPKRYTRQDTLKGSVFHHFTNDKGQNNDIMTIRMQGSTGNIRRGQNADENKRARERFNIWHQLYQLTREPMLLLPEGSANVFYITYTSPLIPVPIMFSGFFSQVLKFTEEATKTRSSNYSMEFLVQETWPDINTLATMVLDFVTTEAVIEPTENSQVIGSAPFNPNAGGLPFENINI